MPNTPQQSAQHTINTSVDPFGSNAPASLAYRRAERLVTATYMVTNHIGHSEPLRARVRERAGRLLDATIALRRGVASLGSGALQDLLAHVRVILSELDALYAAGYISSANLSVLKSAYIDFSHTLEAMASSHIADGVELTEEFFTASAHGTAQGSTQSSTAQVSTPKRAPATTPQSTPKQVPAGEQQSASTRTAQAPQSARAEAIVELIRAKGSLGIGDIAEVINDCSTKTLQRELLKLVRDGVLKRQGAKRWTRYTLA